MMRLASRLVTRPLTVNSFCIQRRTLSHAARNETQFDASPSSSVNQEEIAFFSRLSSRWWDESGEYGQLHRMNPKRVEFIKDKLIEIVREEEGELLADRMSVDARPFSKLSVLDVGCGGGLLSEVS
jgi:polyprenyldihydroxybenzoate methyltransferase/3-demethylubiquinol 3-O-methyltransferase